VVCALVKTHVLGATSERLDVREQCKEIISTVELAKTRKTPGTSYFGNYWLWYRNKTPAKRRSIERVL
jgi:hypothetical protein